MGMAGETRSQTGTASTTNEALEGWQAGLIGGLVGGVGFGALMSIMTPGVLEMAIPAMYGVEGPAGAVGWTIHMAHGAVLGVVLGGVLSLDALSDLTDSNATTGAVGLAYGIAVWLVLAVVVMPIWLQGVGFGMAPEVPNIATESLVGHSVYGVLAGITYAVLAE